MVVERREREDGGRHYLRCHLTARQACPCRGRHPRSLGPGPGPTVSTNSSCGLHHFLTTTATLHCVLEYSILTADIQFYFTSLRALISIAHFTPAGKVYTQQPPISPHSGMQSSTSALPFVAPLLQPPAALVLCTAAVVKTQ
jgi:hypothetical protein